VRNLRDPFCGFADHDWHFVGVASLVAMLSLGIGCNKLATRRLVRQGCSIPWSSRPAGICATSIGMKIKAGSRPPKARLSMSLAAEDRKDSNVTEAYPDLRFITSFAYEAKPHLTMVAGVPESYRQTDAFRGYAGQVFLFLGIFRRGNPAKELAAELLVDSEAGVRRCSVGELPSRSWVKK